MLAVLELIKRGKVNAVQDEMFGDIIIAPVPGTEIDDEEASQRGRLRPVFRTRVYRPAGPSAERAAG